MISGAVEVAKPSRMLEDIRASGEEIPSECEVFNANLEMDGSDVTFEDVIEVCMNIDIPFTCAAFFWLSSLFKYLFWFYVTL